MPSLRFFDMKMPSIKKYIHFTLLIPAVLLVAILGWYMYIPVSPGQGKEIVYSVKKGMGEEDIAWELKDKEIIKNRWVFSLYVIFSGRHAKIQAGKYIFSSSMSSAAIISKLVQGDVVKEKVTIIEGQKVADVVKQLKAKNIFSEEDFTALEGADFSEDFTFLQEKPDGIGLEGYLFPDTYLVSSGQSLDQLIVSMLDNFDKKITPQLRSEIAATGRSLFEIITMASMLEKEEKSLDDKKTAAGILWKRLDAGMPLQVDATVNYVTGRNDAGVAIRDTSADSPYNTYKYPGLPLGPISNPGLDSIMAAVYPTESEYWYYLSANGTGETIFSKSFRDHELAIVKYLR